MEDFSINEMQKMQRSLQDKYKDRWEPSVRKQDRTRCFGWLVK